MSSPRMNNIIVVGAILIYAAGILRGIDGNFVSPGVEATHCESQMQRLSRAKHETFNKWLVSTVYANVQDIFSVFPAIFFFQKQYICF